MSTTLRPHLFLPIIFAVAPVLPSPAPARESPDGKPEKCMVWRFEGEKATIYIAGSIHVLREDAYPLPSPYDAAYEDSSRLTFEIPPAEINAPETGQQMIAAGSLPKGDTLRDHLTEETADAVDAFLEDSGMPATLKQFRPWMFSLTVSMIETMKLGALPQFGIDHFYGEKADKDKKVTGGLEKVEDQVSLFANLSKESQEQMLKKTLADLPKLGDQFTRMFDAWKTGNTEALHTLMFEDAEGFEELMEALLFKRNRNWIDQIVGYIEGDENVMVIVGAAHLAGEGSVIELLEKRATKANSSPTSPPKKR